MLADYIQPEPLCSVKPCNGVSVPALIVVSSEHGFSLSFRSHIADYLFQALPYTDTVLIYQPLAYQSRRDNQ
jgi:hypothetical protein